MVNEIVKFTALPAWADAEDKERTLLCAKLKAGNNNPKLHRTVSCLAARMRVDHICFEFIGSRTVVLVVPYLQYQMELWKKVRIYS